MEHAQAEVVEVGHAAGPPEDAAESAVETLGGAVGGAVDEVVGDPVHPVLQRAVELLQSVQPQLLAPLDPILQPGDGGVWPPEPPVLEDPPQALAVLG